MNSWEAHKYFWIVLALQLTTISLIVLSALGFDIPIVRQVVGFAYLTLLPGLLISRLLRLHKLSSVEALLYSVGLSLAFIMFIGFSINLIYPLIGINHPLSTWPLIITMTVIILILSAFVYKNDNGSSIALPFDWHQALSPPVLFVLLLPLISILGTQLVNHYHNSSILMALILLMATIPLLITFTRFIPERLFPLAIFTIALTLLFHESLVSNYLTGYDIHTEYQMANLVQINSLWDSTIFHLYNPMLSLVMLAPTYSIICGMELTWVFKIIYPIIYALVPLGIYQVTKRQTNHKMAFMAAFFFMTVYTFYVDMVSIARQEIAELFLILIFLAIISKEMNALKRSILCLVCGVGLIVSHYSASYILMFYIISILVLFPLFKKIMTHYWLKRMTTGHIEKPSSQIMVSPPPIRVVTLSFAAFYIVVCLAWYMWQSGSYPLIAMTNLLSHVVTSLTTDLFSLTSSEAMSLIFTPSGSVFHEIAKYLHLLTIVLISLGIIDLLIHWRNKNFDEEYSIMSLAAFILVAAAIPLPYLAIALNTTRLYHLALILLAPFCAMGIIAIYNLLFRKNRAAMLIPLRLMAVLLAILLVFNSGFAHELGKANRFWGSAIQQSIREYGNDEARARFYSYLTPVEDVLSAKWLSEHIVDTEGITIYATFLVRGYVPPLSSYGMIPASKTIPLQVTMDRLRNGAFVYLQYFNVVEGIGTVPKPLNKIETFPMLKLNHLLSVANRIYMNGGGELLVIP